MPPTVLIGVDVGQRSEPLAVCVAEIKHRVGLHGTECHYLVRYLERFQAGTTYPALAARAAQMAAGVAARTAVTAYLYLDATGLGEPVVALFASRVRRAHVKAVYFTHGDRRERVSAKEIRLGKAYLVSRLLTLLQLKCLHVPETPEARALAHGLRDFQIQVAEDANDRYGSFPVGPRDELVTALGLASQPEPARLQVF
jgi:hypothetical protein